MIEVRGVRIIVSPETQSVSFFSLRENPIDFESPIEDEWQVVIADEMPEDVDGVVGAAESLIEFEQIFRRWETEDAWRSAIDLALNLPESLQHFLRETFTNNKDGEIVRQLAREQIRGYYEECTTNSSRCDTGTQSGPEFVDIDDVQYRETISSY